MAQYSTGVYLYLRKVMRIDAHIHLPFLSPAARAEFIAAAREQGVTHFINGGYNARDWHSQLQIKRELGDRVATCFGLHPWWINECEPEPLEKEFQELMALAPQADFIGETGLDGFRPRTPEQTTLQRRYFIEHLKLARQFNKPVVLHIVQAHEDALTELAPYKGLQGLVHAFAGAPPLARRYRDFGFFISVGPGILSPQGYRKLKETVAELDLENFVIESDSPPAPDDGRARPELLLEVARRVSEIKGVSVDEVFSASNRNLKTLWP